MTGPDRRFHLTLCEHTGAVFFWEHRRYTFTGALEQSERAYRPRRCTTWRRLMERGLAAGDELGGAAGVVRGSVGTRAPLLGRGQVDVVDKSARISAASYADRPLHAVFINGRNVFT